jgi:tetratricopeptide (TPR) repeat protein
MKLSTFAVLMLLAAPSAEVARAAPPPTREDIARMNELQQKADAAREAQRFLEAAGYLDQAYAIYPDPRWLANAGYCRMMAGAQTDAIKDLTLALKDPSLAGDARANASERLKRSRRALDLTLFAEASAGAGDHAAAARAYDAAYEAVQAGTYLVKAATHWERAGERDKALQHWRVAEPRLDLSEAERAAVADGLAGKSSPGPGSPGAPADAPRGGTVPVLGWALVGAGAAVLAVGIVGFAVSGSEHSAAEETTDLAAFRDHDAAGETWWNVGVAATTIGLAAAATGVVLVLTHDDGPVTHGSVEVGASVTTHGGLVTAVIPF